MEERERERQRERERWSMKWTRGLGFRLDTAPLTNSWITITIGLYIALHRTPNIDCGLGLRVGITECFVGAGKLK